MKNGLITDSITALSALILYGSPTDRHKPDIQLVTQHPITVVGGIPQLGQGQEITAEVVSALRGVHLSQMTMIPPEVLAFSDTAAAFVVKGKVRPMALPRIEEFDGVPLPQPNLLFVVRDSRLWVYALATNKRPSATTPLYQAPYPNLFHNHEMCRGSVKMPKIPNIQHLDEYEDLFFLSNGTHQVSSGKHFSKDIPDYPTLLRLSQSRGKFDPAWLVPLKMTVGDAIRGER